MSHRPLGTAEVTDIIPFNEFGPLSDLEFYDGSTFNKGSEVVGAPELDDLHDVDDLSAAHLTVPSRFRPEPGHDSPARFAYRDNHTDVSDGTANTDMIKIGGARRGTHRKEATGAIKSRLMIAAMAAGATAAGAYSLNTTSPANADDTVLASPTITAQGASVTGKTDGMQIVSVAAVDNSAVHAEEVTKAAAFAKERADREARLSRPLFVMPTKGFVWTSAFGYRWGVLHAGIDLASPIGTPIGAVADGVVIAAGPTAGYGAWVKLLHNNGTVTLYGHVNTWLVNVGDRVMAGDEIATVGNRGYSTGPHLHFEVLLNGTQRVDPVPWLAERGLSPGGYVG